MTTLGVRIVGRRISLRTIATVALVLIIISAFTGYIWSKNGESFDFSETDVKVVISGSMDGEPREEYEIETIPLESMVFIHKVPSGEEASFYSSLKVGDVLTFDYRHPISGESMVVTHRIISISESDGTYTYTLKGDSIADDPTNGSVQVVTSSSGDVIGKVVGVSHPLGALVVFLSTGAGKLCLIVVPCLILILSEVGNIYRIIRKGDTPEEDEGDIGEDPVGCEPDEPMFTRFRTVQDHMDDDVLTRRF